jgi:hypothetical protein
VNIVERARIEGAVQSYEWWLDLRGATVRRRRELRRELRANLLEAAKHCGARAAVGNLGSTRLMAAEAVSVDRMRPRWTVGFQTALAALLLSSFAELLAALAWLDGATAAHPDHRVTGSLTLFPGSSAQYTPPGLNLTFGPGWLCPAIGLLVLVAVARPWRALTRRRKRQRDPLAA